MKKLLVLVLAFALCFSIGALASDGKTITIDNVTVDQGSGTASVELPISISGNPGIAGLELMVTYDSGLALRGMATGDALKGLYFTKPNSLTANPIKVPFDGEVADNSNGTFMILTFDVPVDVEKTFNVSATLNIAYDDSFSLVDFEIVNGGITVKKPVMPEPVEPEIAPVTSVFNSPYTYTDELGNEVTSASGITFARVAKPNNGYELSEFGMLLANKDTSLTSFVLENEELIKAPGKALGFTGTHFGMRFYGPGINYGITYYTLPYAIYENATGDKVTVYGDAVTSFTPANE